MSTVFTSICGRTSTLTEPSWLLGATRWPSSSTSVREGPKLRSDSVLPPLLVLPLPWLRGVRPPRMLGSLFNASAVSLGVVSAMSSTSTEVIGVGDFRTSVMVREPVTVMTPMSSSTGCCSGDCAQTELPLRAAETPSATKDARKYAREVISSPPLKMLRRYQHVFTNAIHL